MVATDLIVRGLRRGVSVFDNTNSHPPTRGGLKSILVRQPNLGGQVSNLSLREAEVLAIALVCQVSLLNLHNYMKLLVTSRFLLI